MSDVLEKSAIAVVQMKQPNGDVIKLDLGVPYSCEFNKATETKYPIDFTQETYKEYLESLPVQTQNYNFNHIKETKHKEQSLNIGLDIVVQIPITGISLNIGSVQYDTKYISNLEHDHVQVYYYQVNEVTRLLPSDCVTQTITAHYGEGITAHNPTHIVTEVYKGVHVIANMIITKQTTNKMVTKSASGLGTIVIGPISAGIEAALKAVLDMNPDETKVEVTIDGSHEPEEPVVTVEDLFKFLKSLANGVEPKAIKMFCVPIHQFLDVDPAKTQTPAIAEFYLQALNDVVTTLTDFQPATAYPESRRRARDEAKTSDYYLNKVLGADPRLHVILRDEANPWSKNVRDKQDSWNLTACGLFTRAKEVWDEIKNDAANAEGIITVFLEKFNCKFNLAELEKEVTAFVEEGKKLLSLVNADDITAYTKALFYASELAYQRAMRTVETVSVTLHANETLVEKSEQKSSIFLTVYNLSEKMDVRVILPNATEKFSLTFKVPGGYSKEFDNEKDILLALKVLSAAAGAEDGKGPPGRFFQALASQNKDSVGNKVPIPLPLTKEEFTKDVFDFVVRVTADCKDIFLFDTFMTLKHDILLGKDDQKDVYTICLPTLLSTLPEGLRAFLTLRENGGIRSNEMFKFAVGDFGQEEEEEGPLLLIFSKGELKASVLDWVDFLRLKDALETAVKDGKAPDFSLLTGNNSTFYPRRTEYANKVRDFFQFSYHQKSQLVHHPLALVKDEPKGIQDTITTALWTTYGYLEIIGREEKMASALVKLLLKADESLSPLLNELGWSLPQEKFTRKGLFDESQRDLIRGRFMDLFFLCSTSLSQDPLFFKLGAFVHNLDYAIQAEEAKEKEAFQNLEAMMAGNFLQTFQDYDPSGVASLEADLKQPPITLARAKTAQAKIHQTGVLLSGDFAKAAEIGKERSVITLLQSILSIIPSLPEEEKEEARKTNKAKQWRESTEETFHKIVVNYVKEVYPGGVPSEVQDLLNKRLLLQVLEILTAHWYPEWHSELAKKFQALTDVKEYTEVVKIVQDVQDLQADRNVLYFIWSNPAFSILVQEAIEADFTHSKNVFDAVKEEEAGEDPLGPAFIKIPDYIPVKITKILRINHMYPPDTVGQTKKAIQLQLPTKNTHFR